MGIVELSPRRRPVNTGLNSTLLRFLVNFSYSVASCDLWRFGCHPHSTETPLMMRHLSSNQPFRQALIYLQPHTSLWPPELKRDTWPHPSPMVRNIPCTWARRHLLIGSLWHFSWSSHASAYSAGAKYRHPSTFLAKPLLSPIRRSKASLQECNYYYLLS